MSSAMKVALVTGGSRGIGKAMVEEFCAAGYAAAFTYSSNREAANALVECMRSQGRTAAAYQADVRDFGRAREVAAEAQKELGEIVVLVNNAGIKRDGSFVTMTPEAWADVIDTNLNGVFNYTRVLIKDLMLRGGAVINVTSVSGQQGMAGQTNYSASKAGIIGFTRSLAREVARFGVRVNAIAPGFIETDMTGAIDESVRKKLYAQIPMGKPGSARDVARLAVYLAGDAAGYVTGQVWAMDGGLS
jgi:3-oxoacyl-[acyl-carrier protein] reductase